MATHKQVVRNLQLYNGAIEFFKKNKASLIKVGSAVLLASTLLTGCAQTEATPNTPTEPVEVEKTYMEELVETYGDQYPHLKWLDEEGKTLNLNGSTYDITDEKAAYGDLWMFAVDISKEDVESTFEYIINFEIESAEKMYKPFPGGLDIPSGLNFPTAEKYRPQAEVFVKTDDAILSKYSKYYHQRFDGEYDKKIPDSFGSSESLVGIGNDNRDAITFEEKNWFIRDYMLKFGIYLECYSEIEKNPPFYFAEELSKTK